MSSAAAATSSNGNADLTLSSGSATSLTSTNTALPTLTTTSVASSTSNSAAATTSSHSGTIAPTDLPSISTNTNNPLDLPTLPGGYNYPAPTVPPRAGAPYLNTSSLPQDFVFIVVGGVIGLVALLILSYRIFVAWTANRSVKRAANANYHALDYKKMDESSHDLNAYPMRPSTGPTPGVNMPGNGSLFFSPTAAAAGGMRNSASYMHGQQGRGSTYLASGYYGAGATPGGGP